MGIGQRVKELRKDRDMTQVELANALQVDQVYISRLETGRLKNVKTIVSKEMACFFHVSLEYLLTGEETKTWDAREIDWSIQDFLKLFLSLSSEEQAQVMAFTGFVSGMSPSTLKVMQQLEKNGSYE